MRRPERLAETLRAEVTEIVGYELNDPRLIAITVTDVRVSDNLREAKIFVVVQGDEKETKEALKALLETPENESQNQRLERIEKKMDLILSVIVVQQKDACEAVGVSPDTVRNRVLRGDTEVLQRDGSRLNYLTLEQTGELKTRKRAKRRK